MALTMTWNWVQPNVQVPEGSKFRTSGAAQAFSDVADSIRLAKESRYRKDQDAYNRARQDRLDEWAEDDRTRKLAEDQRVQNVRKQMADTIQSDLKADEDIATLQRQREDIVNRIDAIRRKWGM